MEHLFGSVSAAQGVFLLPAWVLTLPVCVFLGAVLFAGGLLLISRILGLH